MSSGFGKPLRAAHANCFVSREAEAPDLGIQLATVIKAKPSQVKVMHAVVSITTGPKTTANYVRCPSCHIRVQKVHDVISRIVWDRFRCKCGYDGPMEYIASLNSPKLSRS